MSSILDALSKVEAAQRAQRGDVLPPPQPPPRQRTPLWLLGAALAVGVTIVTLVLWRRGSEHLPSAAPTPPPAAPVAVTPSPPAPAPTAKPAPPPQVVPAIAPPPLAERPEAHVDLPTPPPIAAPVPPPAAVEVPAPAAPPPTAIGAAAPASPPPTAIATASATPPATAPEVAVPSSPPPTAVAPVAAIPAPAPVPEAPRTAPAAPALPPDDLPQTKRPELPASLPRVRVSLLAYSRAPERRSVSLTIDGGTLVMMHEGEQSDGVEVVRILPDRVDLRRGGITFTVQPRD